MSDGERRLAAIMFTDIVGYTALTQSNEAQAMEVLERHNRLLRPFFPRFHGREVKAIGDSFLVEFESALDAMRCATEIQSYLHDYNLSSRDEWKIKLRIGIHLGDVIRQAGDVFGDAVNIASRMEPLSRPEGISFSQQVYDQVQNKFDLPLVAIGEKSLKNVNRPIQVYEVRMPWEQQTPSAMALQLPRDRIAILPLVNISPDPADEYFADGLTEELIGTMSKIKDLSVISRTSVTQYKSKTKPVTEIGKELNAGTVLEGSVRKTGSRVRVSIQMIDANEDKHIWAENYDREMQDIFSVQSEVAGRVAEALQVQLLAGQKRMMSKALTDSIEAHNLYLMGVHRFDRGSPSEMGSAIKYFELACEQDPEFALAHAKVAYCYAVIAGETLSSSEAFPKAKEFLERALSLDDSLAEAYEAQGLISQQYDWDWAATERSYKKAISLNPSFAEAHAFYAWFLATMNRLDDAILEANRALELDPMSPITSMVCGFVNWTAGRNDRARELYTRILNLHPGFGRAHWGLSLLNASESRAEDAVREADEAVRYSDEAVFREFQVQVYASAGLKAKAREILGDLLLKKSPGYISPMQIAVAYYILGEMDSGYEWMKKALEERDANVPMTYSWPTANPARKDPRCLGLLGGVGLGQAAESR